MDKSMLDEFDLNMAVEPLLKWFEGHARILPWRSDPTPYRVWVSEIMLQQTRVEAVKPYFERFVAALPDTKALMECPEERLLKLWEGLGYYNRVRNLQAAARQLEEGYGGVIPSEYEELLKLKGIGHYTAGAIASIAYGKKAPAVDGNVLRVLTRLTGDDTDIKKASFRKKVEKAVVEVMPEKSCGDLNQALMELGATVCMPNGRPKCGECPWEGVCVAHKNGTETAYPVKTAGKERRVEERTILLIQVGRNVAIRKRPEKGLLSGMYEFPGEDGKLSQKEVEKKLEGLGFLASQIQPLPEAKHIFSHVEWHMTGYFIRVDVEEKSKVPGDYVFVEKERIRREFPIPSAFAVYRKILDSRLEEI